MRAFKPSEDHAVVRNELPKVGLARGFARPETAALIPQSTSISSLGLAALALADLLLNSTAKTQKEAPLKCLAASCGLFWLLLFFRVECPKDSPSGSQRGGTLWDTGGGM